MAVGVLSVLVGLTPAVVANLAVPYAEGFESAAAGSYVTDQDPVPGLAGVRFEKSGNARLVTDYADGVNSGALSVTMDTTSDYARGDVILQFDLAGYDLSCNLIELDFAFRDFGDENHQQAGAAVGLVSATPDDGNDWVFVRGSSSDPWIFAYNWGATANSIFKTLSTAAGAPLDIRQLLLDAGQSYSTTTEVMLRWYDNAPAPTDGVSFDDVQLGHTQLCSTLSGQLGIDGNATGLLGQYEDEFAVPVQVELQDGVCTPRVDCPVATTDADGIYTFTELLSGNYSVDVYDEELPSDFILSIGTDGDNATSDPMPVTIANPTDRTMNFGYIGTPVVLPYAEDFEGAGAEVYLGEHHRISGVPHAFLGDDYRDGAGRARMAAELAPGFYHSGSNAVTFDTDAATNQQNNLVFTFDMSAYDVYVDTVLLDFAWMHHGDENSSFDRDNVEVRGSTNDPWITLYDKGYAQQSAAPGVWIEVTALDLSDALLINNVVDYKDVTYAEQQFSKTFQIRFNQYDNADATSLTGGDGATYDDICIYLQGGASCSGSEIGDRVWNDLDGDGVDDPGEPGIPDITVTLLDDQGGVLDTDFTDDTGAYKFILQAPGTYAVVVTPPAGALRTFDPDGGADDRADVTLASVGDLALGTDFGYQFTGSLSGAIWDDRDADGVIDPGEAGIGGVTVELRDGATIPRTTTTDPSGQFTIAGVGPGSWTLFLPEPPVGADATHDPDDAGMPVATPHRADFSLANGENRSALDFGYRYSASISGSIWDDTDEDGVEDAGEPGLSGVTVTLEFAAVPVQVTTTDSGGDYAFSFLPGGSYSVIVDRPAGTNQTLDPDATADDRTSLSLAPSELRTGLDFAYHLQASIGGRVWNDVEGDGSLDGGETGLDVVSLELRDDVCSPGVDCPTTLTDSLGDFEFQGLSAGVAYDIVLNECTLPWAALSTNGANPYTRTLNPLEIVTDANFGYRALTLPLFEGFEGAASLQSTYTASAGCLPAVPGFSFAHDNTGRLRFAAGADMAVDSSSSAPADNFYRSGNGAATLDSSVSGATQNDLKLSLDLSAYSASVDDLILDFVFMDHIDDQHPTDVVDMKIGASPWIQVFDWGAAGGEEVWTDVRDLNLSQLLRDYNTANATSFDFPDGFELRFRQYGVDDANYPSWGDGVSFDDVFLRVAAGTASISGALWKDLDSDTNRDAGEGMACALLELYEDTNGNGVLDGAEGTSPLRKLPAGPGGAYQFAFLPAGDYLLDIVDATLRAGMSPAGTDPMPLSVGAGQVISGADLGLQGGVVLPYSQDFEGATQEVHWGDALCIPNLPDFEFTEPDDPTVKATAARGRLDFRRGEGEGRPPCTSSACDNQWSYKSGEFAATLDENGHATPDSEGNLILHLDLSNYDVSKAVSMDFSFMHHAPLFQTWNEFDAVVYIRGSAADPWLLLYDIEANSGCGIPDCLSGQWQDVTAVDLSGVLLAGSQDFSATSQIRFHFLGIGNKYADELMPWGQGGFTIDDIVINGPGASTFEGTVWNDLDASGAQNGAEAGLPGLQVELRNASNALIDQTTTSATGSYQLAALETGDFTVIVTPPPGGANTYDPDATPPSNQAVLTVPVVGLTFADIDFGYQFTGLIAGTVFDDADGSMGQDGGEVGFPGVPVTLWSGAVQYDATATDGGGNYGFAGLPAGVWTVVIGAPPAGTTPTVDPDGTATLHSADIAVGPGQTVLGQDFGYMHTGSISGSVFDDLDGSASRDGGEDGFVGVPVSLLLDVSPYASTVTDASGGFGFGALPPGNWRLVIDAPPSGTQPTVDPDGLGSLHFADLTLAAGQALAGRDFGYRYAGSIAGVVFDDVNGSTAQDGGEVGFVGIPVSLLLGATPHGSTTTAADGSYSFSNLSPGTWTVVIDTPPAGSQATVDPDGTGTLHRADVPLTAGQAAVGHDFGYRATGSIAGTVFEDADGNGAQNGGEVGFVGVPVSLLLGATPHDSTTTDSNGDYSFSNLPSGTWTVRIDTPPAGTDPTVDPDGTGTAHAADVALAAGEAATARDFGYRAIGSILGDVFDDANGNESRDGGEPGFAGVTVALLQGATPVDSTTTAADGSYSFSNLSAGSWTVRIDTPPPGAQATVDPDGVGTLHTADVTLAAGQSLAGRDFGYRHSGSISGTVFDDVNGNAGQDGGEPGFVGVPVSLLQGVTPVDSTTTAGDGSYFFSYLPAGTFTVRIDTPPAGTEPTVDPDGTGTAHVADVTLSAGENSTARNFGYRAIGTISGTVFDDANGNQARDGGEAGFAGLTVALLQGATPVDSTSTAADGSYSFSNLAAGTWTVRIDTPPAGADATADPDGTGTAHTADVTLTAGQSATGRDFGYRHSGSIAGVVFDDADGSGAQNGGEPGFAGVPVSLLQGVTPVDSTTTAGDGSYSFGFLPAGTFTVRIDTPPTGTTATTDPDGTGTPHVADVTLSAGESSSGRDFGYRAIGAISGIVFDDANGNQAQDGGEAGFAGVTVALLQGATPVDSTSTAADGSYSFSNLAAGTWTVRIDTPPAGADATVDPDGTGTVHTADVTLTAGQSAAGRDFGYRHSGSIAGVVFDDADGSGAQNGGEPGFAGVPVSLLQGVTPVDSTTTAGDGSYSFGFLPAGTFTVRIDTPPAGTSATADPDGTATLHVADVTLTSGESSTGRDFGYRSIGAISGAVFDDANGNAGQDGGEAGFAGLTVALLQGAVPVDSTTTAADGSYSFSNLAAGSWTVQIDTPPAGTDATVDPDGTGTVHTADVTLTAGQSASGRDFGYRHSSSIAGVVFDDADGSGAQNGGEPGFAGVPVSLLQGVTPVDSTTTSGDGSFSFSYLPAGTFTVRIDTPPAGTEATADPDGTGTLHVADVTLTAGESSTGRDFGYRSIGTISGTVFDDADGNAGQNGGETGFSGVGVSLLEGATPVDSTTTAADGSYSFSNLAAGTWTVRIDTPPAGTEATADPDGTGTLHVADVTLAAGESSTGRDFGYRSIGTISGTVFDDADGSAGQNGGETGFSGVGVSLLEGAVPVDSTTTAGDGSYSFANLAPGTFTVVIDTPPAGTDATVDPDGTGTLHTADVTLTAGQSASGRDFGYRHSASIAGVVFDDADGSGVQNGGEPGFAGVPVSLLQGVTPVDSTTTAADGSYSFSNLAAGTWTVRIDTPPAGTEATADPDGTGTLHVADVTLTAGESSTGRDFGYRSIGTISGTVFDDADGSAGQNGGETGFSGVGVSLLEGATPVDSTTTAGDGSYSFANLAPGTFTVVIDTPPAGTDATVDPDGTGTLHTADVTLTAGQSASGRDFGYRYSGSIAGVVFDDADGSGVQNGGEPGFGGVPVSLLEGVTPVDSTTTSGDGSFSFSYLPAGTFTVRIDTPPAGTEATADPDGTGTLHVADVTLTAGESSTGRDFGYRAIGTISGRVFDDADGNGSQNGAETGLAGLTVSLLQGVTPVDSTTTSGDGSYSFTNLAAGTFTVLIDTPPAGTSATGDPDGTATLHRADVTLLAGQSSPGNDFGYRHTASIAGVVFEDADGSFTKNGGEPGFAGVPVSLLQGVTPVDSTTTAGDGSYSFAYLPAGTFTVVIDTPPAGTSATVDPDGVATLHQTDVIVGAGQGVVGRDFGYRYVGSISGRVFDDADGSGVQNGAEAGFGGVPVSLLQGATPVDSTTTAADGSYSFSNLSVGTWTVRIDTPPAGVDATADPDGTATLHQADISLTAGQSASGRDFGYRYNGSIGGSVFEDLDGSGTKDGGEPGFAGTPVSLLLGAVPFGSTTAAADGSFSFSNLPAGNFRITIDIPPAGTEATTDPDGLGTLHQADLTLTPSQSVSNSDFGYRYTNSIAGTVFDDADGSAGKNGSEVGFAGLSVSLLQGATPYESTTTAADGSYGFSNLPVGTWTVVIDSPPAGTAATTDPDGTGTLHRADISLTAGQSVTGQDFGYRYSGSIAGLVFEDTDGSTTQNGAEPGFAGVPVSLILGATPHDSTTTAGDGTFSFSNLPPGTFTVRIDTPPVGTAATVDPDGLATLHRADVVLTPGQAVTARDFGYRYSGSIAGTVFDDADGSTGQNGAEAGFAGVPVSLMEGASQVGSTATDGDGNFTFSNLPAGTYAVVIDTPPAGTAATADPDGLGTLHRADVVLTAGQAATDRDFGYRHSGSVAGTVFEDADGSTGQNGAETGFENVPVSLMDGASQVASTTTDGSGDFSFSNLPAGDYTIVIDTPPAGTAATVDPDGTGTLHRADVTLTPGQTLTGSDFGYRYDGSIAGTVFEDADGSTGQNGEEPGFESVGVSLMIGAAEHASTSTDANGDFSFENLAPEDYTLVIGVPPEGTEATVDPDGTASLDQADVTLAASQSLVGQDFGYRYSGSVAGTVFEDADGSGGQNGEESGFDGVAVSLMLGAVEHDSTTTDVSGEFTFENVPTGDFTLVVDTPPAGTDATADPDGLASLNQADVSLTAGQSLADQDFGYRYSGSIAGTVFDDADGNEEQNGEESGFESIGVSLMFGAVEQDSTTTDVSGDFTFENVPPGDYTLVIDAPPAGTDATTDPDGTASSNQADVSLTAGQSLADQDFGYRHSGSIAGTVFDDADGSEAQNGEEVGFEGVGVSLELDGAEQKSTTTDVNGDYSFEYLPAGDYTVVISTPPAGTDATVDPDGLATLDQAAITLAAGEALGDQDFGYRHSGAIAGTVFDDADGSGAQNGAESGFEGVPVLLMKAAVEQDSATTDVNGDFSFENLPAGDYTLVVDTPPAGTNATTDPDGLASLHQADVTLTAGQSLADQDFGYRNSGSIAGTVFEDTDGSADQNGSEPGLENVPVSLLLDAAPFDSTLTASDGTFAFSNLPAGSFTLVIDTPPLSSQATVDPDGTGTLHEADVALTAGQSLTGQDFGYRFFGSIGDLVWEELNLNGIQDGGEPGLAGVTLDLTDLSGTPITSTTTDANGAYAFNQVFTGDYRVVVTDSGGVLAGKSPCAGANPLDTITIAAGTVHDTADFGYCTMSSDGSIGDLVFLDADSDGDFGGSESGLGMVEIELWRDHDGSCTLDEGVDALAATTTTDSQGGYLFSSLIVPATYHVRVAPGQALLDGFGLSLGFESPYCATLSAVAPVDTWADFGFASVDDLAIEGTVFLDASGDGVFDAGSESGVGGAVMTLYRDLNENQAVDPQDPSLGSMASQPDGDFTFGGLPGGGSQWIVLIDVSSTTVSGGVQTTQTATGGLEPVTLFSTGATGRDFGYTTSPTHALVTRFDAVDEGGQVVAEWQTTSEVGTVGFYLYRWNESLADWARVDDFVAAAGSALGATYRVADAGAHAGEPHSYYLVEVELRGGVRYYGPYERRAEAGRGSSVQAFGATPHRREGIHLSRTEARRRALTEGGSAVQRRQEATPSDALRLMASGSGVHRVAASELAGALGMSSAVVEQRLASGGFTLTIGGEAVSWWSVDGRGLSFYAPESDSLFSADLEFFLEIGEGRVVETRLSEATARVEGGSVATTRRLEEDRFAATDAARGATQEFWFWRALSTLPDANSTTLDFALDTPSRSGPAILRLELFGATETPDAIDHRVGIWLNGRQIESAQWNGTGGRDIAIEIDTAQLQAHGNQLRLELEAPESGSVGIVYLDSIEIDYRRSAQLDLADGQSIQLRSTDRAVTLGGFADGVIEVLDVTDPLDPVRILSAIRATAEGFEVDFAAQPGREYVATGESAVAVPRVTAATRSAGAEAEYLVIASSELSGSAERLAEGHGGVDRLAAEGLLTLDDAAQFSSAGQLPIVSALTCALNRYEVPGVTSLGEALVLDRDGGAIAVFAPTGLSQSSSAESLGGQLMRAALGVSASTLGEAVVEAMITSGVSAPELATFTLLGGPALALPEGQPAGDLIVSEDFEAGELGGGWITKN